MSKHQALVVKLMAISVQLSQLAMDFLAGGSSAFPCPEADELRCQRESSTSETEEFQAQVPSGSTVVEVATPEDHQEALGLLRKKRLPRSDS